MRPTVDALVQLIQYNGIEEVTNFGILSNWDMIYDLTSITFIPQAHGRILGECGLIPQGAGPTFTWTESLIRGATQPIDTVRITSNTIDRTPAINITFDGNNRHWTGGTLYWAKQPSFTFTSVALTGTDLTNKYKNIGSQGIGFFRIILEINNGTEYTRHVKSVAVQDPVGPIP